MYCVNSMYSQDAGCPIFPFDFISDIDYYVKDKEFKFLDLNLKVYQRLSNFDSYELAKSLFGGYTYNLNSAKNYPIYSYRFEALPSAKLLLAIIYIEKFEDDRVQKILIDECEILGIDYLQTKNLLIEIQTIFKELCEQIDDGETIYLSMSSVASVFPGVWYSNILKQAKAKCKIIGIGNQINVPEIAKFILSTGTIDEIENPKVDMDFNHFNKELYDSLKDQFFEYPTYYGTRIIPFQVSYGCSGKCNYCTERKFWDRHGKIRDCLENRDIEDCINEISYFIDEYKISGLTFDDCMINFKLPQYAKLKEFLLQKDLFLSGSLRIDIIDDEMIEIMRQLNFTNIIIGLETLNGSSMKKYNKSQSDKYIKNAWKMIPKLHKNGIMTQINMIFDSPFEEEEDVIAAIELDKEFITYLRKEKVPTNHISIGEIVVNYPSEQYFTVLKDDKYKVTYQKVPECLSGEVPENTVKCFENIPYELENKDQVSTIIKSELMAEVYNLYDVDRKERITACVDTMMVHWNKYYYTWLSQDLHITLDISVENKKNATYTNRLINELLISKKLDVKRCTELCDDNEEKTTRMLLILVLTGLIKIGV